LRRPAAIPLIDLRQNSAVHERAIGEMLGLERR